MDTKVLRKILSYIDTHIEEKIYLSDLAKIAGYSPFYFSRLFSEVMGMPVTGYIRVRKLQYALESLLQGKKVVDVSLMYAFESHEGFTRAFTQLFGTVPSKVKKYLSNYQVPKFILPTIESRRIYMELDQNILLENMYQIVFEVLKTSMDEAKEGFCTEIMVEIMKNGCIKIADNGRGIPLSNNMKRNQQIFDSILSGHPITSIEYTQMGDFTLGSMQTVNSLCEDLQIIVYKDAHCYKQDYVRGIAQHEVTSFDLEHSSGTEIILKPDSAIFGEMNFSSDKIKSWAIDNIGMNDNLTITII